jgi:predicted O-methyltransferase YrrM
VTAGSSSIPEVRRLLAVLAVGRRAAEVGTALGEGAEAIASTASSLVTVELDEELARAARERLAPLAHVEVVQGDWHDVLPPRAPFDLLFLDGGRWKEQPEEDGRLAIDLLAPGAILLIDDMTPGWEGPDPVREFILGHERLAATEILTTPEAAALLAVRTG